MMNFLLPAMVMEIVDALGRGLNQGGGGGVEVACLIFL